jgi:uncharacterized FlaG/YvyC family protein
MERIERMTGGGAADTGRRPPEQPASGSPRRRAQTAPTMVLSLGEALARLEAAAREAGQAIQFRVENDEEGDMVVATRRHDGALVRRLPAAEAIRLAAALAGSAGTLFEGSF